MPIFLIMKVKFSSSGILQNFPEFCIILLYFQTKQSEYAWNVKSLYHGTTEKYEAKGLHDEGGKPVTMGQIKAILENNKSTIWFWPSYALRQIGKDNYKEFAARSRAFAPSLLLPFIFSSRTVGGRSQRTGWEAEVCGDTGWAGSR